MQKRIIITGLLIVLITGFFWTQSRYPALNEKASRDTVIENVLSFKALIRVADSDPLYQRILFSTVNWLNTNKEGMTFGKILFWARDGAFSYTGTWGMADSLWKGLIFPKSPI
jgi:hypothetical protein